MPPRNRMRVLRRRWNLLAADPRVLPAVALPFALVAILGLVPEAREALARLRRQDALFLATCALAVSWGLAHAARRPVAALGSATLLVYPSRDLGRTEGPREPARPLAAGRGAEAMEILDDAAPATVRRASIRSFREDGDRVLVTAEGQPTVVVEAGLLSHGDRGALLAWLDASTRRGAAP